MEPLHGLDSRAEEADPLPDVTLPQMTEKLGTVGMEESVTDEPAPGAQLVVAVEDMEEFAKKEPRFVKKFMNGRVTPEDVFRQFTLRGRPCKGCGSPKGAILIRTFMSFEEAWTRARATMVQLQLMAYNRGDGAIPTVDFGNPPVPYVLCSQTVWCDHCKAMAERLAAKGPSFAVVEIKRGPGEIKPFVSVARNLRST